MTVMLKLLQGDASEGIVCCSDESVIGIECMWGSWTSYCVL